MPAFDIVVVGSGGGLDETNLSGFVGVGDSLASMRLTVKHICIQLLDQTFEIITLNHPHRLVGSGPGALSHIMKRDPDIFKEDEDTPKETTPFSIYSNVKCFLITHAHLDHINSLVVSAGTIAGDRKRIYGSPQTLRDLETVFSDRVWPRLATYDETDSSFRLVYHALHVDGMYKTIFPDISVRSMTVSHGKNSSGPYESSCFFIKHVPTNHEFIFFGDVEPDSIAVKPKNISVWKAAAPKIPHDLSAIFIECSYPSGRPNELLWGHLSPEHLVQEMVNLATEVVLARRSLKADAGHPRKRQKRGPIAPEALHGALVGLRVYIMHCKEHFSTERPMNQIIGNQCRELFEPHNLGLELMIADQGMKIVI